VVFLFDVDWLGVVEFYFWFFWCVEGVLYLRKRLKVDILRAVFVGYIARGRLIMVHGKESLIVVVPNLF
jgi:hypothetical protein